MLNKFNKQHLFFFADLAVEEMCADKGRCNLPP